MSIYFCKCCGYDARQKSNFAKHIKTKKHIKLSKSHQKSPFNITISIEDYEIPKNTLNHVKNTSNTEIVSYESQPNKESDVSEKHICKYCNKEFKYKQGMYRHIKYTCKYNEEESFLELARLMNLKFKTPVGGATASMKRELEKRDRAIERLAKKLDVVDLGGNKINTMQVTNNTMSNSNNTITNNFSNIQIVSYRDSDLSKMTIKDMGIIYSKYTNCIPQCVRQVHCNEDHPEHMNMYISNLRDNYIMVYENQDWQVKDREDVLEFLINDKNGQLEEWLEQHGKEYPDMLKKFNHYMDLYNADDGSINKKIKHYMKIDLYNVKNKMIPMILADKMQKKKELLEAMMPYRGKGWKDKKNNMTNISHEQVPEIQYEDYDFSNDITFSN